MWPTFQIDPGMKWMSISKDDWIYILDASPHFCRLYSWSLSGPPISHLFSVSLLHPVVGFVRPLRGAAVNLKLQGSERKQHVGGTNQVHLHCGHQHFRLVDQHRWTI